MTAHFKGPIQNEPRPEIGTQIYNRKWNHVHCRVCGDKDEEEDILHIITQCSGYSEIRN